jgi:tRNA wybutosine-synthesizing protein 3
MIYHKCEAGFLQEKNKNLAKLNRAQKHGEVDISIVPILDQINAKEEYYSTSSCAGRIMVLQLPKIGDKKNSKILGKWHHTIQTNNIYDSVKKGSKGVLWLFAQSPIFHIAAIDFDAGNKLVKQAIGAGFKNSGIKTQGKQLNIEISSTERLDAPIGKDGVLFGSDDYVTLLINIGNEIIKKSNKKIRQFYKIL